MTYSRDTTWEGESKAQKYRVLTLYWDSLICRCCINLLIIKNLGKVNRSQKKQTFSADMRFYVISCRNFATFDPKYKAGNFTISSFSWCVYRAWMTMPAFQGWKGEPPTAVSKSMSSDRLVSVLCQRGEHVFLNYVCYIQVYMSPIFGNGNLLNRSNCLEFHFNLW